MYRVLLMGFLISFSSVAFSSIEKNVTSGDFITLHLSNKDPNVLSVKNDRIERIYAMKGALLSHLDTKQGIVILKPSQLVASEPFSFLVFTETGKRFTVMVVPVAIPSQDIILSPKLVEKEDIQMQSLSNVVLAKNLPSSQKKLALPLEKKCKKSTKPTKFFRVKRNG